MKHRRIFALSSVLLLWMISNGLYLEEEAPLFTEYFSMNVFAMGFLYAIGLTIIGLLGLLFLYNIYLACCNIFNLKNKLRLTIYDGIGFGSLIISIIMAISLNT